MKYYRYVLALVLVALTALVVSGCSKAQLAATVNGKQITIQEVDSQLNQVIGQHSDMLKGAQGQQLKDQFRQRILDQLIDMALILQEADKQGITVSDKEVDAKIKEMMKTYNIKDQAALETALKGQSTTLEQFKSELKDRMRIEKLGDKLTKDVKVSDKDIENYYNTHKSEFAAKDQIHAAHILVQKQEDAQKILAELKAGADFAALAKKYSIDTGSKDAGGELPWTDTDKFVPEFSAAAWKLEPGQISDIVKTSYGFHIIKLLDKKPAAQKTFDEVKTQIKDKLLTQKKQDVFSKWLNNLRKKANIKKYLTPATTNQASGINPGAQQGTTATPSTQPSK